MKKRTVYLRVHMYEILENAVWEQKISGCMSLIPSAEVAGMCSQDCVCLFYISVWIQTQFLMLSEQALLPAEP